MASRVTSATVAIDLACLVIDCDDPAPVARFYSSTAPRHPTISHTDRTDSS